MSTSPESARTPTNEDEIVSALSHWLAAHHGNARLRSELRDIGTDGLSPDQRSAVEELVALRTAPLLLKTCRLPKHRDKPWEVVPSDYLHWILSCVNPQFDDDTRYTCQFWLDERKRIHDALP